MKLPNVVLRVLLSLGVVVSHFLVLGLSIPAAAAPVPGTDVLYTFDADFDKGNLFNVNHTAPNNNQLQLNQVTEPFPFVNIAASARGTVIRIDVDTGSILGEYLSAPDGRGRDPSRTTVDQQGNVWVANRAESDGGKGSVTRIGLVIGGTRVDASGTPDSSGQYLAPPFQYNTCVDRHGVTAGTTPDGLIKTSQGLGNILPWTNPGGTDDDGGVFSAEDECIINYTRVTGTATRTVAVDANNDVWVGGLGDRDHEKLDGATGQPVPGTQINFGCGGYGGLIDRNGILWSARELLRYDPSTNTGACFFNDRGDYGLGIDPKTGHVWHSSLFSNGIDGPCCRLYELDAAGNVVNSYSQPFGAQGVAVDGNSHVWVAEIFGSQVAHYAPDPANPGKHLLVGTVGGFIGTTGVAVDANGKIWASETNDRASRVDPVAGPLGAGGYPVGAIDLSVDLGPGAGPYNYSDMTGFVAVGATSPQGSWTVVQDSGQAGTTWGIITWNTEPEGKVPVGTSLTMVARASDTEAGLAGENFVPVDNGVPFSLIGRFIEVQVKFKANENDEGPVLSDIRIQSANESPVCSSAAPSVSTIWPPNHKFVPVQVLGVTDPDGDAVAMTIGSIWQDEPVDTMGDGNAEPDGLGVGTDTAQVRAERSGTPKVPGNGRVYHIGFSATDGQGGSCTGTVVVTVPHDQAKPPVDEGPLYDSTLAATATVAGVILEPQGKALFLPLIDAGR